MARRSREDAEESILRELGGILLTMVDNRTNYARDISLMVYDTYSASIKVLGTEIPMSVRA